MMKNLISYVIEMPISDLKHLFDEMEIGSHFDQYKYQPILNIHQMLFQLIILSSTAFGAATYGKPSAVRCWKNSELVLSDKSCAAGYTKRGTACIKDCLGSFPYPCGGTCVTSSGKCPDGNELSASNVEFFTNIAILAQNAIDGKDCIGLVATKPFSTAGTPTWLKQLDYFIKDYNPTARDEVLDRAAEVLIEHAISGKQIDWKKENCPESKAAIVKAFKNGRCN